MALTTAQKLTEAQDALHALLTGQAVTEIRDGDFWSRYQTATVANLRAYIAELQTELGTAVAATQRRRFRLAFL